MKENCLLMFKTVDCPGAARELRFWREAFNRYLHLLEWPIRTCKGKSIISIMADTAGKFAEEKMPFNFFKKVPKIVRILSNLFQWYCLTFRKERKKDFSRRWPHISLYGLYVKMTCQLSGTSCSYKRIYKRRDDREAHQEKVWQSKRKLLSV